MAIIANVTSEGKLDYNYTDKRAEKQAASLGSNLGYDQFLQLLCAEMQYQDPLEPTTNTDYVAQMATFSQLEATLSLESTEQNSLASALVGKQVILKTQDANGADKFVEGRVDYVMYENGKVKLSVNNGLYDLETLDTVADEEYYEAATMFNAMKSMLAQFPSINDLSLAYKDALKEVRDFYDGMTSYQKGFVAQETVAKLSALEERMQALVDADAAAKKEAEAAEKVDSAEATDGAEATE